MPAVGLGSAAARGYPFNVYRYTVVYSGSGSYAVTSQGEGGAAGEARSSFHWRVRYDLLFVYHRGHQLGAITRPGGSGTGTWSVSLRNVGDQDCSTGGGLELNRYGAISGSIQRDSSLVMALFPGSGDYRTSGGSSGSSPCNTTDFWRDWVHGFSEIGRGTQSLDPLTAVVLLRPAQLRRKRLSLQVSNRTLFTPQLTVNPDCGSGQGRSCTQSFGWRGTVTLTKLPRR